MSIAGRNPLQGPPLGGGILALRRQGRGQVFRFAAQQLLSVRNLFQTFSGRGRFKRPVFELLLAVLQVGKKLQAVGGRLHPPVRFADRLDVGDLPLEILGRVAQRIFDEHLSRSGATAVAVADGRGELIDSLIDCGRQRIDLQRYFEIS